MNNIIDRYLSLPEYVKECEEEARNSPMSCHHTTPGEKRANCAECVEENRILSSSYTDAESSYICGGLCDPMCECCNRLADEAAAYRY